MCKVGLYLNGALAFFLLIFDGKAFNVPGVKEHAHFLKVVKDARKIRSRVLEC